MRSLLLVVAALLLSITAVSADPPAYDWDYQWDFDNGLQGWTISGNTQAYWVDPSVEPNGPMLADADVSHGGAGNLFLPDKGVARLDVSALNIGNGVDIWTGERHFGFVLQADVYIPNQGIAPGQLPNDLPGTMNHNAGIAAYRNDGKGVYLMGDIQYAGLKTQDRSWDGTTRRKNWIMEEQGVAQSMWWDKWITLTIDYSYTTPGQYTSWAYIPWAHYYNSELKPAGWEIIHSGSGINPNIRMNYLELGGINSWTQVQFDNVKLVVAPEPSSLAALCCGFAGLAAGLRKRKAN